MVAPTQGVLVNEWPTIKRHMADFMRAAIDEGLIRPLMQAVQRSQHSSRAKLVHALIEAGYDDKGLSDWMKWFDAECRRIGIRPTISSGTLEAYELVPTRKPTSHLAYAEEAQPITEKQWRITPKNAEEVARVYAQSSVGKADALSLAQQLRVDEMLKAAIRRQKDALERQLYGGRTLAELEAEWRNTSISAFGSVIVGMRTVKAAST